MYSNNKMLKDFIIKRVKDDKVLPHLLKINETIEEFKNIWHIRSANTTNHNLIEFSLSFGRIIDFFGRKEDIDLESFLKLSLPAYAELDRYDDEKIVNVLSLKFKPKNDKEETLKSEILPLLRKETIDSWNFLKKMYPKNKFTDNEALKSLWDEYHQIRGYST